MKLTAQVAVALFIEETDAWVGCERVLGGAESGYETICVACYAFEGCGVA